MVTMKTDPTWDLLNAPRPSTSLARVLEQSEHVKNLVEESAEALSSCNKVLKQELAHEDPPPCIENALEKSEAAESKVQEASNELTDVNRALEGEIWFRHSARYASFHDVLTGLPNRALFNDRLEHGLAQAKRHNWILAVMLLDLNGFRNVNSSHGREAGDCVLRAVAQRLKAGARGDDTVSRLGGDEFLYLLMEIREEKVVALIAEKILRAIQAPLNVAVRGSDNVSLSVKASAGIAIFPKNGATVDTLVIGADLAMRQAKHSNTGYAFAR
jgi:diguanylate cyclase (GGDEF)-like protein